MRTMVFAAVLLALVAVYPYVVDERCVRAALEARRKRYLA